MLFEYPFKERMEGVYEENEDFGDVITGSLGPFLFLPLSFRAGSLRGFVLGRML